MSKAASSFFTFLLLCWHIHAHSQYYFYNSNYYDALFTVDLGLSAGGMNCLTDLGGKGETARKFLGDVNWNTTHGCGGLFAAINYNNAISLRMELAAGQVSASDSILKKYTSAGNGRYNRNLSFRSFIKEASLVAELYPLRLFGDADGILLPYLAAGIASYSFNPQAVYNNSRISLPALHTEGQGLKDDPGRPGYPLTQLNVPLGGGFRYEASPVVNFRCELVYRKLFTDYLDDVSTTYTDPPLFNHTLPLQLAVLAAKLADRRRSGGYNAVAYEGEIRGNKRNNDAYFSVNIKCSFVIGRQKIR